MSGAQVDMAALARFLRAEGLMVQKIPERWELVDELPRNSAGKVLKAQLRGLHFDAVTRFHVHRELNQTVTADLHVLAH